MSKRLVDAAAPRQADLLLGYGALDGERIDQAVAGLRAAFDELGQAP